MVLDLTNKRYVYESTIRPNIVWVDLADLDFSEGSPQTTLDLISELAVQGGLAGDVGKKFEDRGPMTFLSVTILRELEAAAAKAKAAPTPGTGA